MQFRDLRLEDAAALLDFELANRTWFERTVEARKEAFYTLEGVQAHVTECLDGYVRGTLHPLVMVDADGSIAGRANLRFIDQAQGSCEIGYRIAKQHCGQGWASASVRHMQQLAYETWRLALVQAYASVEKPASASVLEKNGFVRQELVRERSIVQGRPLDSYRYHHTSV